MRTEGSPLPESTNQIDPLLARVFPGPLSRAPADAVKPMLGPDLAPGQVIADFRLVAFIGRGGMGQVWEARQLSLGERPVALKFVRHDRASARNFDYFEREARAGGRLAHPGLVTVHDSGRDDGLAWIAMELVPGSWTLRSVLDEQMRRQEIPPGYDLEVARLVAEIADAMQAAHAAGVIHRDLKPQNVLMTPEGHPKVGDFGLARIVGESGLSKTGDRPGTDFYMSPEQVAAQKGELDHRTDVFSLGVILYELLTLQRPFQGDTSHQVHAQILFRDPPDPRTIRSRIPRDLAVITGKALEKERDKRFQSMREFAADLRRYLAGEPILARPPTRVDRAVKWVRRNRAKSVSTAIASVAFAAISTLFVALAAKTRQAEANEKRALAADMLSALTELDDLTREADRLGPARTDPGAYEAWLARSAALLSGLPEHEKALTTLRSRGSAHMNDPSPLMRVEEEKVRRELEFRKRQLAASEGNPPAETTPNVPDSWQLPTSMVGCNELALALVDADRKEWGNEAIGLLLARRALELSKDADPRQISLIRDTLAWALFANGRFDEALWELEDALSKASPPATSTLETSLERMSDRMADLESEPGRQRETSTILRLEHRLASVEAARWEWSFDSTEDRWWHDTLMKLVEGLKAFGDADPELGLAARMRGKLDAVEGLTERSITAPEASRLWQQAAECIRDPARSPHYRGLVLSPQLGLLPVGMDPHTGLWEFAHLESGVAPERDGEGRLHLTEESGLVFVLLPGATVLFGAQSTDRTMSRFDSEARPEERPGPPVPLEPFFLSKYEMTQSQWMRTALGNPSLYRPGNPGAGAVFAGRPTTLLHPVENVSWEECQRLMVWLDLSLPTEAQWEYACRAGTETVWWPGDDRALLSEAANLADLSWEKGGPGGRPRENWQDGYTVHAPVGTFAANDFGLHDVCGNVSEWCREWLGHYEFPLRAGDGDRYVPGASARVIRGGSFPDLASEARSAFRRGAPPDTRAAYIGLRPARAITQ